VAVQSDASGTNDKDDDDPPEEGTVDQFAPADLDKNEPTSNTEEEGTPTAQGGGETVNVEGGVLDSTPVAVQSDASGTNDKDDDDPPEEGTVDQFAPADLDKNGPTSNTEGEGTPTAQGGDETVDVEGGVLDSTPVALPSDTSGTNDNDDDDPQQLAAEEGTMDQSAPADLDKNEPTSNPSSPPLAAATTTEIQVQSDTADAAPLQQQASSHAEGRATNENQSTIPWYSKYQGPITIVLVLTIIGLVAALVAVLVNKNSSDNDGGSNKALAAPQPVPSPVDPPSTSFPTSRPTSPLDKLNLTSTAPSRAVPAVPTPAQSKPPTSAGSESVKTNEPSIFANTATVLSQDYYCGTSWPHAASFCEKHCATGQDSECASLGDVSSGEVYECYYFTGCYDKLVDAQANDNAAATGDNGSDKPSKSPSWSPIGPPADFPSTMPTYNLTSVPSSMPS